MLAFSGTLDGALTVLADGKPRTADQILAEGKKRGLFGPDLTAKPVYAALEQYIERTMARGRTPLVTRGLDHRFCLNRPIDDWPAIDTTGLPPLDVASGQPAAASVALTALEKAAAGTEFEAFEIATCNALEVFGFSVTHQGGTGAPDGYADAMLGELSYRIMIECKLLTGRQMSNLNAAAEAAKYRDLYHADYCILVALSFYNELTFISELHSHGVSAWTVDDILRVAALRLDCSQMRELLVAGFAADALDDLAWERVHGSPRRLRVVASLLVEIGLEQQRMAHTLGDAVSAPRLTADVALSLIDDRLAAAGSTHGVTREEIDAAFTWLTSPYVERAIWTDDDLSAIVIRPSGLNGP